MNHVSARGTSVYKDPVAEGSVMHSQNKHGTLDVRGSMTSLERKADTRKGEECGIHLPQNGKGVNMQELPLQLRYGKMFS